MDSVSVRTTSSDSRSVPDSPDPRDFRHNASNFLAYSSSIAARAAKMSVRNDRDSVDHMR